MTEIHGLFHFISDNIIWYTQKEQLTRQLKRVLSYDRIHAYTLDKWRTQEFLRERGERSREKKRKFKISW